MSHEGYLYRFDRRSADDGKFWRWLQSRSKTDANDVFIKFRNSSHKHPRDPDGIAMKEILTTMRQRAERDLWVDKKYKSNMNHGWTSS